jgi:hypothetical protein
MRRLDYLIVAALLGLLILVPGSVLAQSDPAAKALGLTPDTGSLPVWTKMGSSARQELGNTARTQDAAVFLVGHPKAGTGTAWVISKKHRLLATNAHVADLQSKVGGTMMAIPSESNQLYIVEKVWYHPGVRRYFKGDTQNSIRSMNPADGPIDPHSPDLAVLQLAADGPELPAEFPMATPDDLKNLFAQEAAILGFPAHDTTNWPAMGEKAAATYHDGVISRITDFRLSPSAPAGELQFVQYTMATWPGFSGSPVFLANGRVAAVHNMANPVKGRSGEIRTIPHGIRVDSLWELLVYHKLEDKIASKINPGQVLLDRWLKPDEQSEKIRQDYARAVTLVSEASNLILVQEKYDLGIDKCTESINLMPYYARAYLVRAKGFMNYWFDYRRRIPRNVAWTALENARKDANQYAKIAPSDPEGIVLLCWVLNNIGSFSGDKSYNQTALNILNELLESENLTNYKRAEAQSARAVAYDNLGDKKTALKEHNEAIRLAPDYAVLYENRADFWHYRGRRDLEKADFAKARELRKKQQSQ